MNRSGCSSSNQQGAPGVATKRLTSCLGVTAAVIALVSLSVRAQDGLAGTEESCPVPTSTQMQHDFDIARLMDLAYLSEILEAYQSFAGEFPFAGDASVPTYVYIATREQRQTIRGGPPYEHRVREVNELIGELERVLGRALEIPFDPQRSPDSKPSHYVYLIDEDTYYLAVHLHEAFPFARRVDRCYYKLEITNDRNPPDGAWNPADLTRNRDFMAAVDRAPVLGGAVKAIRTQIRDEGAFE